MSESVMVQAALEYAAAGIPVLPLHTPTAPGVCSCRRVCDSVGKHPRLLHGLRDASTDPEQLRTWWRMWPSANIGLVTGVVMDVCDIDSEEGLAALLDLLGDGAITGPTVATGSGGWHAWVQPTGRGNRVGMLPGVDWRGTGGYVVAPPSLHATGRRYAWSRPWSEVPIPVCPERLRQLVEGFPVVDEPGAGPVREADAYAEAALRGEVDRVLAAAAPRSEGGRVVPGNRNDTLNRAAYALGQLVGGGLLDRRRVERELTSAARQVGLGAVETARTIHSGLTAGARRPRRTAA
jgi:hypothetical protein